jgi:DNA-binding transcriptional ArsR family regulator
MIWDSSADSTDAKKYIVKLGKLLAKLRGHVEMWSPKKTTEHEHEYSGYEYSFTDTEDPARACTELYNLSRGHALLTGRNYIVMEEDLPIAVKVVLSTAAIERVAILDLLLAKKELTLSEIPRALSMSKSTALKAMTALFALGVVKMEDLLVQINGTITKQITIRHEFKWLYDKEFTELREAFNPIDNSRYDSDALVVFEKLASKCPNNNGIVDHKTFLSSIMAEGFSNNDAVLMIVEMIRDKVIEEVYNTDLGNRNYKRCIKAEEEEDEADV